MHRDLKLGWIWVALYTMAGTLTLLHLLSSFADHVPFLLKVGAAGFIGAALVSRFADGLSLRECLLASVGVGVGVTIISILPTIGDEIMVGGTYRQLLSTLIVIISAALAGSHVGAAWADLVAYEGRTAMGAIMAAIVLVGALVCHVGLIAVFEQVNHQLAIFLILLSILVTPSFAGAALQLSQGESVERQLGLGVALIASVGLFLAGWEFRSAGIMIVMALAFVGVGAVIYFVSLPGVMTVRSSAFWQYRCNHVPVAVARLVAQEPAQIALVGQGKPCHGDVSSA